MTAPLPTVLITGATSRIGRALSTGLAKAGWQIVGHTVSGGDRAEQLKADIEKDGGKITILQADLTDADELQSLYSRASEPYGPPQVLINNASIFEDDGIGNLSLDRYETHFQIHTRAPVFLADAMATNLPAGRDGLIVNLIDQRVWKLTPHSLSYTLSKSALWTATQTLAQALAPRIRVNGIGPGPSFKSPRQSQEEFDRQTGAVLLQHGPTPEEFPRTVQYLWEARSVTGQMIALDGGQHLGWETPDVLNVGE